MASLNYQRELRSLQGEITRIGEQLADMAHDTRSNALGDLKRQFGRVRGNVDGLISDAGERGREWLSDASERGWEAADTVRSVADDVASSLEETMHRRPLATLALAVGAGFLLAAVLRR